MTKKLYYFELCRIINEKESNYVFSTRDLELALALCVEKKCDIIINKVEVNIDDQEMLDELEKEELVYNLPF